MLINEAKLDVDPSFKIIINDHLRKSVISENKEKARFFFLQGLKELKIIKKDFPIISLYNWEHQNKRMIARELKKAWKDILGIDCYTESYDWKTLLGKAESSDYQLVLMNWHCAITDPMYTFNWFRYKEDLVNFSNWESVEFQNLLNSVDLKDDFMERKKILQKLESHLLEELPILPLYVEKKIQTAFSKKINNNTIEIR